MTRRTLIQRLLGTAAIAAVPVAAVQSSKLVSAMAVPVALPKRGLEVVFSRWAITETEGRILPDAEWFAKQLGVVNGISVEHRNLWERDCVRIRAWRGPLAARPAEFENVNIPWLLDRGGSTPAGYFHWTQLRSMKP